MNQIINFLVESTICFAAFYLFFELFQRRVVCFNYNRIYLLSTAVLSIIIPAINIRIFGNDQALSALAVNSVVQLSPVEIESGQSSNQGISWPAAVVLAYSSGAIIFLTRTLGGFYKIFKLAKRASGEDIGQPPAVRIVNTHGALPTFSFFGYIFWDNTRDLSQKERDQIVNHELIHIRHGHSWDALFFEIITIFFWFNPFLYLYKRALREVHEFIADSTTSAVDKKNYIRTLAKQGLDAWRFSFIHPFNKSQILKRIKMLENANKNVNWLKLGLIIPVIAVLVVVFSCQTDDFSTAESLKEMPDGWTILDDGKVDDRAREKMEELKEKDPNGQYYYVSSDNVVNGKPENQYWTTQFMWVDGDGEAYRIAKYHPDGRLQDNAIESSPLNGGDNLSEIFTIVEQPPAPKGGMAAFYQYMRSELQYPTKAKDERIEGKVFVEFVIDREGTVKNAKVIKGIGGGCDEEALRVINLSPAWNPGTQRDQPVNVKLILPITFKLDG